MCKKLTQTYQYIVLQAHAPVSNVDSAVIVSERQAVSPSNVSVSVAPSPKSPAVSAPSSSTTLVASSLKSQATPIASSAASVISSTPVSSSKSPVTSANKAPPPAISSVATSVNNDTINGHRMPATPSTASNGAHADSSNAPTLYTSDIALNSAVDDAKPGPVQQPQQGETLADLKRRRAQQNQLNSANRRSSMDIQPNGGEASSLAPFGSEPPKHRFIAPSDMQPIRPAAKEKGCCTVM